jgi:ribonucleoside-diphosphate reductase alpha chain
MAKKDLDSIFIKPEKIGSRKVSYDDYFKLNHDYTEFNFKGLKIPRIFTTKNIHPFDDVEFEFRTAIITNEKGEKIFEQKNIETPKSWSQAATNIVASKYLHGTLNTPERENSIKQLINRVVKTITTWGIKGHYFTSLDDAEAFSDELTHILVTQKAAFNSPVWFNCGIEEKPQCSACFINSVKDTMTSILELVKTEGMLFKWGSGTGTNFSTLRSSRENLSGGGIASGPVSFMKGFDAFAGIIKSGGKTRRAAKMVILNIDHPDIVDFINCKAVEEKKAWSLIDSGYDGGFNVTGGAYDSISYQNANHSVRVADEFMKAVLEDKDWSTKSILDSTIMGKYKARDLMNQIAESARMCGDPGIQFDTTINNWHTCGASDRIYASNPCSEFMFLNDTACNLSSINVLKFRKENGDFNTKEFCRVADIMILAQEILVDNASYPTLSIEKNSHDFRPLGLGYANLGALLISNGLPYDSDESRAYAATITAIMTGEAYKMSSQIASILKPFKEYQKNKESMLNVIRKHKLHIDNIKIDLVPREMLASAIQIWDETYEMGKKYGFKNSQVTVLAPTGTIGFMMDCDTTGIEPDIALVKYKKLVGGGVMKIVNNTIPLGLKKLGYSKEQIEQILAYIDKNDTIEEAPHLLEKNFPVFDCAFKPANGKRFIHYMGHIKMMAAVQPFLSGAISKTVNLPIEATTEEITQVYIEAWKLGLKSIAIYRDGSKKTQPLNTSLKNKKDISSKKETTVKYKPVRKRLPDERQSITHKFSIAGHEGYATVGMYEDGQPGEVFIVMSKEGTVVSGLMDSFATAISLALQYGVPLKVLVQKFSHTRFEPSGFTNNREIPMAKSIADYIFRWLALKFLPKDEQPTGSSEASIGEAFQRTFADPTMSISTKENQVYQAQADAPPCFECGAIMVRSGSCYKCLECGSTSGCS